MSVRHSRVRLLLVYLDILKKEIDRSTISSVAEKATTLLLSPSFSDGRDLTNHGYALAADIGLLVVEALENKFESIRWAIQLRPKSDISYLMPCYTYLGSKVLRNPIFISTSSACAVIRQERGMEQWLAWHDQVVSEITEASQASG